MPLLLCILLLLLSTPVIAADGSGTLDSTDAAEVYHQALNGDVDAQFLLFQMYRSGVGVERDIDTAKRWLHSAGYSGHAEAQYWLGYIYFSGQGVERSIPQAMDWYEHSAQQAYVPAEFILGHIYNGFRYRVFDRVPATAIHWYTLAAQHGHIQAMLILGCKEYYGEDMAIDKQHASTWFNRASELGEPDAYSYYRNQDEDSLQDLCHRVPRS